MKNIIVTSNKSLDSQMTARAKLDTFDNERLDQRQLLVGVNRNRKKIKTIKIEERK